MCSDELYLLDLRNGENQAQWIVIEVKGPTPGRRYGHTISFFRPHLLIFGGNTGTEPVNDVWCLNVESCPFKWAKIECNSEIPPPRSYHSGAQCLHGTAAGMLIIFGGRSLDHVPLNDTWGLRRHRDQTWDWIRAPSSTGPPIGRYQHSIIFIETKMIVSGGRTNQVNEGVPLSIYDTESSKWTNYNSIKRFRHSCWFLENQIYFHGGFLQSDPNLPTTSITRCNIGYFSMSIKEIASSTNMLMTDSPIRQREAKNPTAPTRTSLERELTMGSKMTDINFNEWSPMKPYQEEKTLRFSYNEIGRAHV